jgi:hypothetical protein
MFQINETEKKSRTNSTDAEPMSFESIEKFSDWLDSELEQLTDKFAAFETDKSVRKYFTRS